MLHIFNGDVARDVFAASGVPGDGRVFADALHGGRLLRDPTSPAFTSERIAYAVQTGLATPDAVSALHASWCRGLAEAASHEEVVLWFEHDLFDQLLLIHHIEWLAREGVLGGGRTVTSLVCIGAFEGISDFAGLGQLSPEQLATLLPGRTRIGAAEVALARAAWSAVAGDDPRAIEAVVAGDTSALPFLAGALERLLEEYPDAVTGLSRTEAQALRAIAEGAGTPRGAFRAQAAMEERVFLGDASFWQVLRSLAEAKRPLIDLEVEVPDPEGPALPHGTVRLTELGHDVHAGRADHAAANGLDRWVGGVHLSGTSPRWRRDAAGRVVGPIVPG